MKCSITRDFNPFGFCEEFDQLEIRPQRALGNETV